MAFSAIFAEYFGRGLLADRPVAADLNVPSDTAVQFFATDEKVLYQLNAAGDDWDELEAGIPDAPSDGKNYVRKDAAWVELPSTLPAITGQAGKILAVNSAGTGVEWIVNEGGGGSGLPDGGLTGQILAKVSDADGDADWVDLQGETPLPFVIADLGLTQIPSSPAQVIPLNAFTVIQCVKTIDALSNWNDTDYSFMAPQTGRYLVVIGSRFVDDTVPLTICGRLVINGSADLQTVQWVGYDGPRTGFSMAYMKELTAGDKLQLQMNALARAGDTTSTGLQIAKLRISITKLLSTEGGGGAGGPGGTPIANIPAVAGEFNISGLDLSRFKRIELIFNDVTMTGNSQVALIQVRTPTGLKEAGYSGYKEGSSAGSYQGYGTGAGSGTSALMYQGTSAQVIASGKRVRARAVVTQLGAGVPTMVRATLTALRPDGNLNEGESIYLQVTEEAVTGLRVYCDGGWASGTVSVIGYATEELVEKSDVAETDLDITIPMNSGWTTPYGGWGNEGNVVRIQKVGRTVMLSGLVNGPAGIIATLPPGFRPKYSRIMAATGEPGNVAGRVQVSTNGEIFLGVGSGSAGTYVTLAVMFLSAD